MTMTMEHAIDFLLNAAQRTTTDLEVLATNRKSTAISFQKGNMEQFSFSDTHQIGVRVLDGQYEGLAYSESLEASALGELLELARDNARMIKKEWAAELNPGGQLPTLPGLFSAELEKVPVSEKIEIARHLEGDALAYDTAIISVAYTRYADVSTEVWMANSKGLRGQYATNFCTGYTYCLASDGENRVMDGEAESHRQFSHLNAGHIARRAAEKTLARRGAVRPTTGTFTVVFENRAAEQLLGLITNYFSAKAVVENKSLLKYKMGQKIFSTQLSIVDDPLFVAGAGSRPFDEEGYQSQKTMLVQDGVLKSYLTNSTLARQLKLTHTASASRSPSTDLDVSISNFLVEPGQTSFSDLLNADSTVLLVTSIKGTAGFRSSSADFSIPMEGQLYRNGQLAFPLKDFLISGNMIQLLAAVEAVGNDVLPPVGSVVSPSLLVRGLNVIGQS